MCISLYKGIMNKLCVITQKPNENHYHLIAPILEQAFEEYIYSLKVSIFLIFDTSSFLAVTCKCILKQYGFGECSSFSNLVRF